MLLRIRGKGACPENSQAALLHLRGFRHVQCPPPAATYTLATLPNADHVGGERRADDGAAVCCPMDFSHFAICLQAPSIVDDQRAFESAKAARGGGGGGDDDDGGRWEGGAQPPHSAFLSTVWKEVWNTYDICLDEVPLLPEPFHTTEEQLKKLCNGAAASVTALPEGFVLPSRRSGSAKAVVCTHYCSQRPWPSEVFHRSSPLPAQQRTEDHCTLVVVDLSDLPASTCGSRLAVSLAWAIGFASLQEDNVLLRAGAVMIALPYAAVPQWGRPPGATAGTGETTAATEGTNGTFADAFAEMRSFLAQTLQLVITACHVSFHGSDGSHGEEAPGGPPAVPQPPVYFVGSHGGRMNHEDALSVMRALSSSAGGPPTTIREVVVLQTDEHRGGDARNSAETREAMTALAAAVTSSQGSVTAVQLLVAPVRALIDGGEEPWDAYTQKERSRMNYCPCCGNCGAPEEQHEGSPDAGHHHHHHSHGHGGGHGHSH